MKPKRSSGLRAAWVPALALASAAIALPASAQTSSTNLYTAYGLSGSAKVDSATGNYGATQVDTTSAADTNYADDFWVYCLDPKTGWVAGSSYTVISGLDNWLINIQAGQTKTYAQQLYSSANYNANAYGDTTTATTVRDNLIELYSYAYADSMTSGVKSAAFQYAVWEIVGEPTSGVSGNPYSRTTGLYTNSTAASTFTTQVDTYLSALFNNTWSSLGLTASSYTYTVYSAVNVSQTFLQVTPGTSGTGVPEPATLALVAAAGGLVLRMRRAKPSDAAAQA